MNIIRWGLSVGPNKQSEDATLWSENLWWSFFAIFRHNLDKNKQWWDLAAVLAVCISHRFYRHRRMLTCLLVCAVSCTLCLSVFLTTWLPGMRAVDARLAFTVSTGMGKVNQQIGTPTPSILSSPLKKLCCLVLSDLATIFSLLNQTTWEFTDSSPFLWEEMHLEACRSTVTQRH